MKAKDAIIVVALTSAITYVIESYGSYCYKRGWKGASEMHGILEESQSKLIDSLTEKLKQKEGEV